MSYDDLNSQINEIRSRLKKREVVFSEAKNNIRELESLASTFESSNIKYDKKQYKKAVSAFESGEYGEAKNFANLAREATESSISEMDSVNALKENLMKQISELESYHGIIFQKDKIKYK